MRVHALLAAADTLPQLLDAGTPPPTSAVLRGVDPVRRPSIHLLPVDAADALGNSDAAERARWAAEWTGGNGRPDDAPEKTVEALAQLAASRAPEQALYLWVADGR